MGLKHRRLVCLVLWKLLATSASPCDGMSQRILDTSAAHTYVDTIIEPMR